MTLLSRAKAMPLPESDWLLHMPAGRYEPEWTSSQTGYSEEDMRERGEQIAAEGDAVIAKLCEALVVARPFLCEHLRYADAPPIWRIIDALDAALAEARKE